MVWRRLPTYFPNIPLRLMPLSEAQQKALETTGHVDRLVIKTIPRIGKVEIKALLENIYGLNVAKVNTANYEGKKRRGKQGLYRDPDFKKAYVLLKPPQAGGDSK